MSDAEPVLDTMEICLNSLKADLDTPDVEEERLLRALKESLRQVGIGPRKLAYIEKPTYFFSNLSQLVKRPRTWHASTFRIPSNPCSHMYPSSSKDL